MNEKQIVDNHINENYINYIKIVKSHTIFRNSRLKDNIFDLLNDTILYMIDRKGYGYMFEKLNLKNGYKNGLMTQLDSLIIYILNSKLGRDATARKIYLNDNLSIDTDEWYVLEDSSMSFEDEENEKEDFIMEHDIIYNYNNIIYNIEELEAIIDEIEIEYPFKKKLYKERWGFDKERIEKKTLKELQIKYNINKMSLSKIMTDIEKEIRKIYENKYRNNI